MCGIAGIISLGRPISEDNCVTQMMGILKHRGPDDQGYYYSEKICLGHVRLSIIDLSSDGHQPMFSETGRYVVVFNGEIYNYIELREELKSSYNFKSKTDTEVILAAWQKWGSACLNKFNGDWALVIYDTLTGEVFAARDRYGIKPFYYFIQNEQLFFASEIKALIPFIHKREVNSNSVFDFIVYNRTDRDEHTFLDGITKLKHGHFFKINNGKPVFTKWYNLPEKITDNPVSNQHFRETLRNAVKLRLRSDVPVGVCLSGGLDSSAICSLLVNDLQVHDLNTFSAIYGKQYNADESSFIDEYKPLIKNMHFTVLDKNNFYNEFTDFIHSQGEPVASIGPFAQYKVMQLAGNHVGVTIDGQGADEQLGGYHYFFGAYFKELLLQGKLKLFIHEFVKTYSNHQSSLALKYFIFYMLPKILKNSVGKIVTDTVNPDFFNANASHSTIGQDLYNPATLREAHLDHFEYKLEHLLKWEDHNAMRFSIESRTPFLDHNFVEMSLSLPSEKIIKDGTTKHILRESLSDILPERIKNRRDKKGFSTPSEIWFREKEFVALVNDILNEKEFQNMGFFDINKCKTLFKKHLSGKTDASKEIWKWINMSTWSKTLKNETIN